MPQLPVCGVECILCSTDWDFRLIKMPGMWTHLLSPLSPVVYSFKKINQPVSFPVCLQELCSDPKFIVGGADRTDICQGQLGRYSHYLHELICYFYLHVFYSFTHDAPVRYHRRLLASGSYRISDPQTRTYGQSHPPRPGVRQQICRHLSLPGIIVSFIGTFSNVFSPLILF